MVIHAVGVKLKEPLTEVSAFTDDCLNVKECIFIRDPSLLRRINRDDKAPYMG